jgi:predicted histone-like DNA-binding protein
MKYKVQAIRNPRKASDPAKFYAKTVWDGEVGLIDLCKEIEKISTVSEPDIMAVLTALVNVVPEKIADSKIVRLGDLGSLRGSISSEGHEDEKSVTASSIKRNKVLFQPGQRIKRSLQSTRYKKVS